VITKSQISRTKELECQLLNDELKRKISEIHLKIRSGTLTPSQLNDAETILFELKRKMEAQGTRLRNIAGVHPSGPTVGSGSY
jgi:hypothetical protein